MKRGVFCSSRTCGSESFIVRPRVSVDWLLIGCHCLFVGSRCWRVRVNSIIKAYLSSRRHAAFVLSLRQARLLLICIHISLDGAMSISIPRRQISLPLSEIYPHRSSYHPNGTDSRHSLVPPVPVGRLISRSRMHNDPTLTSIPVANYIKVRFHCRINKPVGFRLSICSTVLLGFPASHERHVAMFNTWSAY